MKDVDVKWQREDFALCLCKKFFGIRLAPCRDSCISCNEGYLRFFPLQKIEVLRDKNWNLPNYSLLHSVFSSYLLIKHISSPIMGCCLILTLNERILLLATFFTELILRIGFTCPPAMAAKSTLLNKNCSNEKILADLLFQL